MVLSSISSEFENIAHSWWSIPILSLLASIVMFEYVCVGAFSIVKNFEKKCGKKIKLNFVCLSNETNKNSILGMFRWFFSLILPRKHCWFFAKSKFFCPQFGKNFVAKKYDYYYFRSSSPLEKNDQPITINWKSNQIKTWIENNLIW